LEEGGSVLTHRALYTATPPYTCRLQAAF
jgi:hypothetical protein